MTGTIREARRRRREQHARRLMVCLAALAGFFGVTLAHALGLGQATVRSYHQQPLNVRIDLISRSEAEMATVTAGLASPADFQVMGLNRAAIAAPLEFTIHRDLSDPHIEVTSKLPVNDLVVQLVVEVVWSSGRMLRQYTLFLDPPTFQAPAPLPATPTQRPVPPAGETVDRSAQADIAAVDRPEAETSPFRDEAPLTLPDPAPAPTTRAANETPDSPAPPRETAASPPVTDAGPPFDPTPPAGTEDFGEVPDDLDGARDRDLVIGEPEAEAVTVDEVLPEPTAPAEPATLAAEADSQEAPDPAEGMEPPATESGDPEIDDVPAPSTSEAVADAESDATDDVAQAALSGEDTTEETSASTTATELAEATEAPGETGIEVADPVDERADGTAAQDDTVERDTEALAVDDDSPGSEAAIPEDEAPVTEADPEAIADAGTESGSDPEQALDQELDQEFEPEFEPGPETALADADTEPSGADLSQDTESERASETGAQTAEASESVAEPESALAFEPEAPAEPEPDVDPEPAPPPVARAVLPEPGQPLPSTIDVQRGDTLWSLSRRYAEAQGVSINQVMLAVQQKNPDAFIRGNINAMKAGEVLRMPERDETLARSSRDAMLEVMRQEELYRTRWDIPTSPEDLPTISNLAQVGPADSATPDPAPAVPGSAADDSRLELVPPSEGEDSGEAALGQGNSDDTSGSSGESVVEELARTQEELANAQQENAYLEERITELEAELARREASSTDGVADTNLAELEERLREERQSEAPEPEAAPPPVEPSWLARFGPWLLGLGLLAIIAVVLFLRSRRNPEYVDLGAPTDPDDEPLTLPDVFPEPDEDPEEGQDEEATRIQPAADEEATRIQPAPDQEVEERDPNDPETRLDLARAYVAMGNAKAARELLEGVIASGNDEQVQEAREMLGEL